MVDPYIDQTIFYRYLNGIDSGVEVIIVTNSKNLKGERLKDFESVESLFKQEYKFYKRVSRGNLHDRYLLTEASAFSLGGSIKDAAIKSDYSVIQLGPDKKDELLKEYS